MRKYKEISVSEIKEGSTIIKNHGFSYTVESIRTVSSNVRLLVLSDSKGNEVLEYTTLDKKYNVREEQLNEGKLYDRLVSQLLGKGMPKDKAHATATMQLQKSGSFKTGTKELTKHGKKRQKMGAAGRAKDRAAKRSGKKPSAYNYNPRTNGASLKEESKPNNPQKVNLLTILKVRIGKKAK